MMVPSVHFSRQRCFLGHRHVPQPRSATAPQPRGATAPQPRTPAQPRGATRRKPAEAHRAPRPVQTSPPAPQACAAGSGVSVCAESGART
jgi:hypothetical protein